MSYPPINLTEHWADLNDHLIELVGLIPDDKLDWSPGPELWTFRGTLQHLLGGRLYWLANVVNDGGPSPDYDATGKSTSDLQHMIADSWQRLECFLANPTMLSAKYQHPTGPWPYLDPSVTDGHYVAYHRFVHDVEHRGDILRLLATLGIDLPPDRRRRPL
jgi:uncharacterized damage-inducible protein DinB